MKEIGGSNLKPNPLAMCGILGCGNFEVPAEMRHYHLVPGTKVRCCVECWKSMEIPLEFRDSEEYKASDEFKRGMELLRSGGAKAD